MARRPDTSVDGALYELVARGQKDKYFFKDDAKSIQPFDYRYDKFPATLPEVRRTVPLNAPKFGNMVEWEFEFPGDFLQEAKISIELPSWLPPAQAALNGKSVITDLSGVSYGWTNGIGYFLFRKIELYHDQFLLQEVSGDALYALARTRGSYNSTLLEDELAGIHGGSQIGVQRNATPGLLSFRLPMPGCQQGDTGLLPICALREQTFRVRAYLRSAEELVEASNGQQNPYPWDKLFQIQTQRDGPFTQFRTLRLIDMAKPVLTLKTRQIYVSNEMRKEAAAAEHIISFRRYYENIFTFNQRDYAPIDRGAPALSVRQIDAQFLGERVVHFFRNSLYMKTNQLIKFEQDASGQFYDSLKLVVAGQDREGPWAPIVWGQVMQHAKEERATSKSVITMNWGYGWRKEDQVPARKQPQGGLNFTTAMNPQLNVSLVDIPPVSQQQGRNSEMRSIVESWAVFEIKRGRGRFKYAN